MMEAELASINVMSEHPSECTTAKDAIGAVNKPENRSSMVSASAVSLVWEVSSFTAVLQSSSLEVRHGAKDEHRKKS